MSKDADILRVFIEIENELYGKRATIHTIDRLVPSTDALVHRLGASTTEQLEEIRLARRSFIDVFKTPLNTPPYKVQIANALLATIKRVKENKKPLARRGKEEIKKEKNELGGAQTKKLLELKGLIQLLLQSPDVVERIPREQRVILGNALTGKSSDLLTRALAIHVREKGTQDALARALAHNDTKIVNAGMMDRFSRRMRQEVEYRPVQPPGPRRTRKRR